MSVVAERLQDFVIGLTDFDPAVSAPTVDTLRVCATSEQAVTRGASALFDCEERGRYLVVQLKGTNYLTACEVEVYGGTCFHLLHHATKKGPVSIKIRSSVPQFI
jgi:hypothetical protein